MGRRLLATLEDGGISTRGVVVDPSRPTSTKTRVLGRGTQEVQQQIVRIDRVDTSVPDQRVIDRLADFFLSALPDSDAVLVSDYESGVISPELLDSCLPKASDGGRVVTVDSHGDLLRFKGITAATPNQPEVEGTLGREIRSEEELDGAGCELLEKMGARGVLITRGSQGVALFERDRPIYRLPVALNGEGEVVDPTGAGDTVSAVFTLAISSGSSMREAAYIGNVAGGLVVRKYGAATVTPDELRGAVEHARIEPPTG